MEPRLEYEDRDDVQRSQLFSVRNDVSIAALANAWHQALLAKGFEDIPLLT